MIMFLTVEELQMRTTQLSGQASQRVLTIQPYDAGLVPKGYDEQVAQATTPQSAIADALLATAELYETATPKPDGSPILPRARGMDLVHTFTEGYD